MRVVVCYATKTGKCELMAKTVKETLSEFVEELDFYPVNLISAKDLLEYDLIFLGSPTYGEGELPDDFNLFYEELDAIDLKGKSAAIFGCGNTRYPYFCNAVNLLESKLLDTGANILRESFKVSGVVEPELPNLKNWAERVFKAKASE